MTRLIGLVSIAAFACACGSVVDDPNNAASPDGGAQAGAPRIVSISPADGAGGVRANARVVVEFSEPMDQQSVESSVNAADLGTVTLSWNSDATTLSIIPDSPLKYADGAGDDPSTVNPNSYSLSLGEGATDADGEALEQPAQLTFTTLKRMTTTVARDNELTAAGTPSGVTTDADDYIYVGDDAMGSSAKPYRGYITMDLSSLPQSAVDVESAKLRARQVGEVANPYGVLGGGDGLLIDHGMFDLGNESADNEAFNMQPLAGLGVFANTGQTNLSLDVTAAVRDDLQNRDARYNRNQYRLRFAEMTNLDTTANYVLIGRDGLALDVVYLAE